MALDLAPSNFAGLAALASGGSGNLNLTVPGALGLQGLQIGNQNAASVRDAAIQQMQIRQQAETALRQQQIARQELAQQGQYQQGLLGQAARGQDIQQQGQMLDANQNAAQLGFQQQQLAQQGALGQGQLDVEKQKLAQDQMAKEMAKLLDEKKEKLQEKGSFVAYGLVAMKQAKTPEEVQMIRNEIINSAVSNKYITEEQARALRKAPLSQFTNFLTQQAMVLDSVSKYKDVMDANKDNGKNSPNVEFYPDGTIKSVSSTTALTTDVQKSQVGLDKRLIELRKIQDSLEENKGNLTYAGKAKLGVSTLAENLQGMPVLGDIADKAAEVITGKDAAGRSKDIDQATTFINGVEQLVMDYQHDKTGAAAAMQEIDRIRSQYANSSMSYSQLKAALNQIIKKNVDEQAYNKYILKEGVNVGNSNDISSMSTEEIEAELAKLRKK